MRYSIALLLIACAAATAGAEEPAQHQRRATGELLDVTPNAYGLGVNSDQYGRPHAYRTPDGDALPGVFTDGVRRDAYGLGAHADEFGRPLEDGEP
jgi:hypothetical protein